MLHSYFNPRSRVGNDRSGLNMVQPLLLFQSAFPRGERLASERHLRLFLYFNPRSRVGNDRIGFTFSHAGGTISIHVPAWGTTNMGLDSFTKKIFQSTFPRGERQHTGKRLTCKYHNFNPRSRVGNDCRFLNTHRFHVISIHVPAWGTTANFHKYSLLFYAINIIFLLFIIPSLFSLVLFVLLF